MASGAQIWSRARSQALRLGPFGGDALLYALSAVFAGATVALSTIPLYRQWGELAVGPYLAAAALSAGAVVVARRRGSEGRARWMVPARVVVFVLVLAGATVVPLAFEVVWRSEGNPTAHVQPEVVVVEHAARRAANGQDPYQSVVGRNGKVEVRTPGTPVYEGFFPYLPLMTVFGLPSSTKAPIQLTDPRIFFSVATLLVVAVALVVWRGPPGAKVRTLQVLTVLPTAALPLATGGDDMPIVALLLLAMVLAQRRRPVLSGLVLGVVASMKFTAWPLALFALFAARDRRGRRVPLQMLGGMVVVAGPVVIPFVLRGPFAFFENVILFPLGLAGVASPAASALPGHLLVTAFPGIHRVLPAVLALAGGAFLVHRLVRHPPVSVSQAVDLAGWVMAIGILFAPATRVGYLLYPVNLFVWGAALRATERNRAAGPVRQGDGEKELAEGAGGGEGDVLAVAALTTRREPGTG